MAPKAGGTECRAAVTLRWKWALGLANVSALAPHACLFENCSATMLRIITIITHHSIPPVVLAMVVGFAVLVAWAPWWVWLCVLMGIPAQMMNEYMLHRFAFHLPPPKQQWAFNLLYQAHYGHHDFPTNTKLFFAPVWVSVPMMILNFGLVWCLASLVAPVQALLISTAVVLVGGVATFLSYEWFHMTAHVNCPKKWVARHVTKLHNQHHFRDFSKWFHVSPGGEVIDRAMGTAIDQEQLKQQQRVEFIRTLGMRPDDHRLITARQRYAGQYGLTEAEIVQAARA